ncbi:extracellular solute-binding protein [Bacillus sp. B1-b2]|uniref:sugar ABC transporter substrate-binding protein n=1 Tax=Bacillus sp. B1-b2 TaxID=2653201 RepID=UPI001262598F|nr:extracellular solute-binding protein [Bacillus sp. B1-b2]KAB7668876.1 extracellular solute-binding protein [Bacillus sp. B1-b2]
MKKKLTAILLSSSLALALTGCGPSDETTNETSSKQNKNGYDLLVWEDQSKSDGIAEAIKKFEEEKNVKIKVEEKAYADQLEDLRLDGPAGTGADVITIPADQIGTAVTEGILKEITIDDAVKNMYTEAAIDSQMVEGKVYGLPKAVETTVLYYNKDLVSEEELPKTIEEWYDFSKEVTKDDNYGLLALWDQIYYANGILSGYGGYVFGKDSKGAYNAKDIGLDNTGAIEGAEYISTFYKDGLFPSGIIGEQGINVLDSLFTEGKAAAVISGPWNLEPYAEAGINYGVMELPLLANGEHMGSFIGVKSYNVSTYSKNAELAEELVEFLANEENSKARYEITKEVPAVKALAEDPAVTESESATAVANQSQYSQLTPGITAMDAVWQPIDSALQTIATGKANPKDALSTAVETIEGTIAANSGN